MEAEAEPEPVGERQMVVGGVARIGGARLLGEVAGLQVAAVGGDEQADVGGARLGAAFQHRAQGARLLRQIDTEIVDEEREGAGHHR